MKINLMVLAIATLMCAVVNEEIMEKKVEDFMIIGISVQTTNENGKSMKDMGMLWQRFYAEGISGRIPNKESEEVYVLYTEYESDYTGPYRAIIGYKVGAMEHIPEGLDGWTFQGGNYVQLTAKGEVPGSVVKIWNEVWAKDAELNRRYTVDYEVYGTRSQHGPDSEVDVFIAVK
ncbi:MAG: effector binding domain-containing protein [Bacteroidota bacterium]